jgi:lipid A 3-O-deacylase
LISETDSLERLDAMGAKKIPAVDRCRHPLTGASRLAALGLLLVTGVFPHVALAAESAQSGTLSFVLENDMFYSVDRHYTNGLRFINVPGPDAATPEWAVRLARLAPWFPAQGEIHHGYSFGHSIFVSSDIKVDDPLPGERPYAGWLYGSIGLGVDSGSQLDQFELVIGMVGPAALAEESHKFIHKVFDANQPQAWDTQLGNEPGIVVTSQRSWRGYATATASGAQLDFTPHIGAALGNVFTYGNAGGTLGYGKRLPRDYGPPRIQPALPSSGYFAPMSDFDWYLFAGIEARLVARNIFLDGNSFRDSRSVDKYPLVGDLQFGLAMDWRDMRLSYTHVIRSREFRTQDGDDQFGAFVVSVKY